MRSQAIVVFDGWLDTLGGGERQTVAAARSLSRLGQVYLVGHRAVPRDVIEARLGIDLGDIELRTVPDDQNLGGHLRALDPILFVNGTHYSYLPAICVRSIKFEYFPPSRPHSVGQAVGKAWDAVGRRVGAAQESEGWHGPETLGRGWYRQSDGVGVIVGGRSRRVRLWLSDLRGFTEEGAREYRLEGARGNVLDRGVAGAAGKFLPTAWVPWPQSRRVIVRSTGVWQDAGLERRRLGLALGAVEENGPLAIRLWHLVGRRIVPWLGSAVARSKLADFKAAYRSYSAVSTNSAFTAHWLRRWWGMDSEVIYPPVIENASDGFMKDALILSVGRFFAGGHNKRHDVMSETFRMMCEGRVTGWTLALMGGLGSRPADAEYKARVEAVAAGYPIEIRTDVSDSDLRPWRARASIYWHAAGYGVDASRHPERMEHFGMAVAEAMESGAVPVVFDGGGLREIVRHGVNGFRWRTRQELAGYTMRLMRDMQLRETMSRRARIDSQAWSLRRFESNVIDLADRVLAGGRPGQL